MQMRVLARFCKVVYIIQTMSNKVWKGIIDPSPRGKVRWRLFLVIILALVAGHFVYPQAWNKGVQTITSWFDKEPVLQAKDRPFRLGLDLAGGAHLVYEADVTQISGAERDEAMEGVRDVIERRVNAFGVAEPLVQTARTGDSWRIVVELAGVKDVKEAIKQIGETPVLEFKEEAIPEPERELTPEEQRDLEESNKKAKQRLDEVIAELKKDEAKLDFTGLVNEYSDEANVKDTGGIIGFITRDSVYGDLWEYAHELGKGKIGLDPVENAEGWNIIRVLEMEDRGVEVEARHLLICFRGAELCDKDWSKDEARTKIEEIKTQATTENFEQLVREHSTEPGASDSGGDLGWFSSGMMVKPFEDAAFALEVDVISDVVETEFGYHLIHKRTQRPSIAYNLARILIVKKTKADYIPPPQAWKNTDLSGKHLKRSSLQFDPNTNLPQVSLEFNKEGKALFGAITERNVGKLVAIFLDGMPISVPRVQTVISDGEAVITGSFTIKEAKLLAQRLNAGALPVPISLLSQQTVGATLGARSVDASLKAGLIGFLAIALFMILYYRLAGVLAVLALSVYGALVLALFKLVPVTLTLAGIAGFILSVGMAVDANILIFARLKEEIRAGKSLATAVDDAFKRAWPSIRDSNCTTLFAALIFFYFSTSLVKGFGLTLSLGILVSLFASMVVTRVFLRMIAPHVERAWWYGTRVKRKV